MGKHRRTAAGNRNWKPVVLKSLASVPNVSAACRRARISRQTYENHHAKDEVFAAAVAVALNAGIERLEESAFKRAADGLKRGVWRQDKDGNPVKVETITEYSDAMTALMLKAHKGSKYRESVEHTGPDGGPLSMLIVHSPIDPASVTGPPPVKKEDKDGN